MKERRSSVVTSGNEVVSVAEGTCVVSGVLVGPNEIDL